MKIARQWLTRKAFSWVLLLGIILVSLEAGLLFAKTSPSSSSALKTVLLSKTPVLNTHASDSLHRDLIFWLNAQKGAPNFLTFQSVNDFMNHRPTWPGSVPMQKQAELALAKNSPSPATLTTFFSAHPPLTPQGKIAYLKALLAQKKKSLAQEKAKEYWHETLMDSTEEKAFLKAFGTFLNQADHNARFQYFLLQESLDPAERLLPSLPEPLKTTGLKAIQLLRKNNPCEPKCYKELPLTFQKNELLLWAYLKWLRTQKAYPQICDIFLNLPEKLNSPKAFHKLRILAAREWLEARKPEFALQVLKFHNLPPGSEYAEAEWLSGWIALCFLDQPQLAKTHFKNFEKVVKTPISLARASYWLGRTYTDLKKPAKAKEAYQKAASYKTTFYGQFACYELGRCPFPLFLEKPHVTAAERKAFETKDLVRSIRLLAPLGKPAHLSLVRLLCALAASTETTGERQLVVELAAQVHPYIAVDLSRTLSVKDPSMPFLTVAYPFHAAPPSLSVDEKALALAICYRESRFNPEILGAAGELGLMQLMPQTAIEVAETLNIAHHPTRLLNPQYNIQLGTCLLQDLGEEFDQNYFLVTAAYNGGRGSVRRWIGTLGHPKGSVLGVTFENPAHRVIQWTEAIPYDGTRDYVPRGIEAYIIYAGRLGKKEKDLWATLLTPVRHSTCSLF